jgi:hypothetical protein
MRLRITMTVDYGLDPGDVSGLDELVYSAILHALMPYGYDIEMEPEE